MTPSPLLEYFDTRFVEFTKNFHLAAERLDHEGIHDYRVALKRMKALFRLATDISPTFDAVHHFRSFKRAFKVSARLRDLHIQLGIADELSAIEGFPSGLYRTFLLIPETKESTRFLRFAKKFDTTRLLAKRNTLVDTLGHEDSESTARSASDRLAQLMEELATHADHPEENGGYHTFRIRAKETHYVREMCDLLHGVQPVDDGFLKDMKKVHQALGGWHDHEVAQEWLARFAESSNADVSRALAAVDATKELNLESFRQAWEIFLKRYGGIQERVIRF